MRQTVPCVLLQVIVLVFDSRRSARGAVHFSEPQRQFVSVTQENKQQGHHGYRRKMMELGLEVGGVFNFIRNRPEDTEHTKERKIWVNRFRNGMCPHCGQKLYKVKLFRLRRKFVPLNIDGKVDNGVCIHSRCRPPSKEKPDTEDDDVTVSRETDSMLDAIEEHRADMAIFYQQLQKSNSQAREASALALEDTIMQLNRSMAELSSRERAGLVRVKQELLAEVDEAQRALNSLQSRVSHVEDVTKSIKRQVVGLREDNKREYQILRGELQALQVGMKEMKCDSDRDKDGLQQRVDDLAADWRRENETLRQENGRLRRLLEACEQERTLLAAQVAASSNATSQPLINPEYDRDNGSMIHSSFKCYHTLTDHSEAVTCCTLLGGGRGLVSGSDTTLFIWKIQTDGTFQCRQKLGGHRGRITCCTSLGSNGTVVVSGSEDGTLRVWSSTTTMNGGAYQCRESLSRHSGPVYCCAMSRDNNHHNGILATTTLVSGGKDRSVIVWQPEPCTGAFQVRQVLLCDDCVACCALSCDSQTLVTGDDSNLIRVWERYSQTTNDYTCRQVLRGHDDGVLCCDVVLDDSSSSRRRGMIVSGGKDHRLLVWTTTIGQQKYTLQQSLTDHSEWINCCRILDVPTSRNSSTSRMPMMIVSGSDDHTLRIWRHDGTSYTCQQTLKKHGNYIHCCDAVVDSTKGSSMLVSGGNDNHIKVWTLRSSLSSKQTTMDLYHTFGES